MFALAHDYRVMNNARGFLCMNEVDIPAPITPGMAALLRVKYQNMQLLNKSLLQAHRFDAKQAVDVGLVDAESATPLEDAINMAQKWRSKGGPIYAMLKSELWQEAVSHLASGGIGFAKL
jgi:enoyl-CoA hydratase/carnithine racemase